MNYLKETLTNEHIRSRENNFGDKELIDHLVELYQICTYISIG